MTRVPAGRGRHGGGSLQITERCLVPAPLHPQELEAARAARAACKDWLPTTLRRRLNEDQELVGISKDQLGAALQVGG